MLQGLPAWRRTYWDCPLDAQLGWYMRLRLAMLCAAEKAMTIAADTCIYTNHNFTTLSLKGEDKKE